MNRAEFLARLHKVLNPRGYLEIGVQTGASLQLARCRALGIDPDPRLQVALPPTAGVMAETSDEFFARPMGAQLQLGLPQPLDLAFIDGLHLVEQALRDFAGVERWSNPRTVVCFDDVLPRNQEEAVRTPLPGDWTGDVWKVHPILAISRTDLHLTLVDTEPTGVLLVRGLNAHRWKWSPVGGPLPDTVPDDVLKRSVALDPESVLAMVAR